MKTFKKLPVKFKTKWIAALRSGNFKQGQDELYNKPNDIYCCLGVACYIAGHERTLNRYDYDTIREDKAKNVPVIIKGCYGHEHNPVVSKLIDMNDGHDGKKPLSFKQIANWIEKNL